MCGTRALTDLKVPVVMQKVTEAVPWPENRKPLWGGDRCRRFIGLGGRRGLRMDVDKEEFEADFEEFEGDSSDSNLELGCGRTAEKDDDNGVVEIQPFTAVKRSLSQDDLNTMPTVGFDGPSERLAKRKRKNQFRGIHPAGSADFASNQPLVPAMNSALPVEAPVLDMYSDQGSNSFGCSDLGWEYDTKTPHISSIASNSTIAEGAKSALAKNNTYISLVPPVMENNAVNFEPWMRYLMDDGMDELIDSLLNFDVPQDVVGNMDLLSFDGMPIRGEFF
ncbi:ethylene-responsive transcription factor 1-like [Triticum dicoccoides]|uniref:Uncharacterized protein n=1 Tax=Triticum turgidum subsp. durum TaxID=4567 RepID=A0A9R1BEJ6_TRITD|nr:ethylene-responsive transcription factor 1-like [Triticum dicoccoides]XP_044415260.1 ethylene-responsive transcription factor 1-like [Triticum aestivum]VAI61753.1 unnamed protein product [Triticum turgidum subsp. durum]